MVQRSALSPLQQQSSGFKPGLSLWSFHVLPVSAWVPSGCSSLLTQPKDMQVRQIASKLLVSANLSTNGSSSLCVNPVMNW